MKNPNFIENRLKLIRSAGFTHKSIQMIFSLYMNKYFLNKLADEIIFNENH